MMMAAAAASVCADVRRSRLIAGFILLSVFAVDFATSQEWSYGGETGPDHWSDSYPNCGGQNQSPIDIDSQSTTTVQGLDLIYTNYDQPIDGQFTVTNNGHSVQISIPVGSGISIDHGLLPSTYTLAQFHFHWGSDDSVGSEHNLDSKPYPMEIHLVHYNSDMYSDFATAVDKTNGLAVLGIFVEVDDSATFPEIDDLISHFSDIAYEGDTTTMSPFSIRSLLPASNEDYFRYRGSLTTPPCYESVTWSVFRSPVKITTEQIKNFRALHSNLSGHPDEALVDNARPIQPLNGRSVLSRV